MLLMVEFGVRLLLVCNCWLIKFLVWMLRKVLLLLLLVLV